LIEFEGDFGQLPRALFDAQPGHPAALVVRPASGLAGSYFNWLMSGSGIPDRSRDPGDV
jgi:hypothetical protein